MNLFSALRFAAVPLLAFALVACPTTPAPDGGTPPPGTVPVKPGSFTVAAATATSLTLTWQLVPFATGYVLERKTASSAFAKIAAPSEKTNAYTDSNLTLGTTYSYTLKAINASGSSDAASLDAVPSAGGADSDGDGISDADELAGYDIAISRGGTQISTRKVASNPSLTDSDNDGLSDAQERTRFTDPLKADTDADGLSDNEEVNTWVSNPSDVDTDNDSGGNASLFDGNELKDFGTSPTLPDSDGDQYSDYREIIELGNAFNPLVANTPRFELSYATAPSITVDIGQTGSTSVTKSKSSSLALSSATSRSSTDTQTQRFNAEVSATVGVEVGGGTGGFNVTASASVTATIGYGTENTKSFTNDSSQATEKSASEALEEGSVSGFELKGGKLTLGIKLKNTGDVAFTMTNLGVTALRRDPSNPSAYVVVGTMGFEAGTPATFTLGNGESTGTLGLTLNLAGSLAQELMSKPADLKFEFSSFDIKDANDRSFKFQNDTTNALTALLVLDYGNGNSSRYRVATNVQRTAGQISGVKLGKVLTDTLKLNFTTALKGGTRVLNSLFDPTPGTNAAIASSAADKTVWAVVGTNGLTITSTTNVDDIVLRAGSEMRVMLLRDFDSDKLLDSEEYFYGTSDSSVDTDGEGLNDFAEVRSGWTVATASAVRGYPKKVFPNPTLKDTDADTLSDSQEQTAATDPRSDDTDRDGTKDAADPQPLNPAVGANIVPVISAVSSSVAGSTVTLNATVTDNNLSSVVINWGDGSTTTVPAVSGTPFTRTRTYTSSQNYTITITATDAGGLTASATQTANVLDITSGRLLELLFDGNTSDSSGNAKNANVNAIGCAFLTSDISGVINKAFKLNQDFGGAGCGADSAGYLNTANIPFASSTNPNFSFSLRIKPNVQSSQMFVAGQSNNGGLGAWARFFIDTAQDGATTIGSSNKLSFVIPGSTRIIATDPTALSGSATWVHYVATVANSAGTTTLRLYRNGALVNTATTTATYINPSATNPFYIGNRCGDSSNSGCDLYSGSVDSIRIYNRTLSANEVAALFADLN